MENMEIHGAPWLTSSPTQEGCGPHRHADAGLPSESPRGAHHESCRSHIPMDEQMNTYKLYMFIVNLE